MHQHTRPGGSRYLKAKSGSRKQPWSTYAVFQTTILQWALLWDCLLIYLYHKSTDTWDIEAQTIGLGMLLTWMFLTKFLKLLGHYIRYPVDFLFLPISIMFGYLHGLIKARAMLSLNVVSVHRSITSTPHAPFTAP